MGINSLRVANVFYGLLISALLLTACNLPLGGAQAPVTYKVGPSGNEVKHSSGARVVVPLGSLKEDAEIRVSISSENPPAVEGSTPLGKAYEISLSKGAEMLFPLEIYLPLERKPGARDSQYSAMRWEGSYWTRLQGEVEGDFYHFSSEHTTLFRLFYWEAGTYPVEIIHSSYKTVRIWPWRYETFSGSGRPGYFLVGRHYPDGTSHAWAELPPGIYTEWCVEWPKYTVPEWDIFGGGYWTEFLGNFHYIFSQTVVLNRYSERDSGKPNVPRVTFTIGEELPGLCGPSPDIGRVNPNNPLREQPMPWTTLEPTRTSTPRRTSTPARTSTAPRTATPLRTSTPRPSATPLNTPTLALNFSSYIVSSQHIDRLEALVIVLAHDQDYVVLTGPITIQYEYWHRASLSDPVIKDPRVTVVIKSGENHRFVLYDLYGLNDIYLYLISSP